MLLVVGYYGRMFLTLLGTCLKIERDGKVADSNGNYLQTYVPFHYLFYVPILLGVHSVQFSVLMYLILICNLFLLCVFVQ